MRWSVEKANSWVRERDNGMGWVALLLDRVGARSGGDVWAERDLEQAVSWQRGCFWPGDQQVRRP